jgi:alpha-galactosidase/6-phospho-beta-glucosidase family protein
VSTQVTIIGGGSYQWAPELMADLFGTPALAGMHLVLEDVDPAPLPKMEALAHKVNEALGAKATIASTTDQKAALEGADFVIVCISTGGFRSMAVDLDVPAAHGITQTVGDSVGPGGINRALRNIPVLVGIAKDMEEMCPDAWLFNITNPMTTLTRSVCRETGIKAVGLCHEVGNFTMDLAIALGKPWDAITPSVTGVNHFPVLTSLDVDGDNGFDIIRDLVEEVGGLASLAPYPGRPEAEAFSKLNFAQRHVLKLIMLDRWGTFPAAGDRHIAEFVSFALTPESEWGAAYNIGLSPITVRERHQAEYVADVDAWLAGTKDLQTWQSGELPSPMIAAMLTGEPFEAPVNIPNAGQAPGLPADVVLESICVIDGDGIRGRDVSVLPEPFNEIVRRHTATQELTVEAALKGDRALAAEAFALDPLAGRGDLRQTDAMVEELMAGTAEWLPQFA